MCDLISRDFIKSLGGKCIAARDSKTNELLPIISIDALPSAQPEKQHERIFQEIIVEYPSYSTYPECKGKPYFSIKYAENGQEFIGYGTYKPDVLSEYLKEYFMPSAKPEQYHCPKQCGDVKTVNLDITKITKHKSDFSDLNDDQESCNLP